MVLPYLFNWDYDFSCHFHEGQPNWRQNRNIQLQMVSQHNSIISHVFATFYKFLQSSSFHLITQCHEHWNQRIENFLHPQNCRSIFIYGGTYPLFLTIKVKVIVLPCSNVGFSIPNPDVSPLTLQCLWWISPTLSLYQCFPKWAFPPLHILASASPPTPFLHPFRAHRWPVNAISSLPLNSFSALKWIILLPCH
jgi:hypothetical protein